MIDLINQREGVPAGYPVAPDGLTAEAAALDSNMLWARIESYTAHRFTDREVVWTLQANAGDQWCPPLTPVTSRAADIWVEQWESVTLADGPLGICIPQDGTYKITAHIGGGDVPAAINEAFRRLAEYSAEIGVFSMLKGRAGATSHAGKIGELGEESTRGQNWAARAIVNSGAADLLRPYRRA